MNPSRFFLSISRTTNLPLTRNTNRVGSPNLARHQHTRRPFDVSWREHASVLVVIGTSHRQTLRSEPCELGVATADEPLGYIDVPCMVSCHSGRAVEQALAQTSAADRNSIAIKVIGPSLS